MKKPDNKTIIKSIRFSPDIQSILKDLKDRSGESESDVVRSAILFFNAEYDTNRKIEEMLETNREIAKTLDLKFDKKLAELEEYNKKMLRAIFEEMRKNK